MEPVFRIPDTFQAFLYSIKMVLDRKPIYQLPLNLRKTNRNSYSASISVSQILTKKIQLSIFMDVLQQEGLLGRHIKESLLIKQIIM
jgi:hypothetical protein